MTFALASKDTITLHLGVVDIPYGDARDHADEIRHGKRSGKNKGSRWRRADLIGGDVATTGDVAQILEEHYGVMSMFFFLNEQLIADWLADALAASLETILQGGPAPRDPFLGATEHIDQRFRDFLDADEMSSLGVPGIPTDASGKGKRTGGINHRLKHPYSKSNPQRPSFVDTGTYSSSFRSWVDM